MLPLLGGIAGAGVSSARDSMACRQCASDVGSGIFKKARSAFSFFGKGDYSIKSNSLIDGGGATSNDNIQFVPAGNRETRIVYREYLGDVVAKGGGVFGIQQFPLNPGLQTTFPWLSTMATHWDQYTFNGVVFQFKTTSSDYTANQALGSVIMATEYDSQDGPYTNKQDMLNSAYAQECKPSSSAIHGVECSPRDTPTTILYTRNFSVDQTEIRDYDWGIFCIATQGGTQVSDVVVGSLYIHYDITFRKEQLPRSILVGWWANWTLGSAIPITATGNYFGDGNLYTAVQGVDTNIPWLSAISNILQFGGMPSQPLRILIEWNQQGSVTNQIDLNATYTTVQTSATQNCTDESIAVTRGNTTGALCRQVQWEFVLTPEDGTGSGATQNSQWWMGGLTNVQGTLPDPLQIQVTITSYYIG